MVDTDGGQFQGKGVTAEDPAPLLTTDDLVFQLGLDVVERLNAREAMKRLAARILSAESAEEAAKKAQAEAETYKSSAVTLDANLRALGDELTKARQELVKAKADLDAARRETTHVASERDVASKTCNEVKKKCDELAHEVTTLNMRLSELTAANKAEQGQRGRKRGA